MTTIPLVLGKQIQQRWSCCDPHFLPSEKRTVSPEGLSSVSSSVSLLLANQEVVRGFSSAHYSDHWQVFGKHTVLQVVPLTI
jgi:hypothetical protein